VLGRLLPGRQQLPEGVLRAVPFGTAEPLPDIVVPLEEVNDESTRREGRCLHPWWRIASPSMLHFSLALFFLPWTEVRCAAGAMQGQTLASQSGFQSAIGTCSAPPAVEAGLREDPSRGDPAAGRDGLQPSGRANGHDELRLAALLPAHALALLAAVAGIAVRRSHARQALVILFTAAALIALGARRSSVSRWSRICFGTKNGPSVR
jgi:hypothetical protein